MKLSEMLKTLAKGINPETGEVLSPVSSANKPETIRLLFTSSEEL